MKNKIKTARSKSERHTLADVRHCCGMTQVEVAARAKKVQADISVIEHRRDVKTSTLARYARALGGRIEMTVILGDKRFVLDLPRFRKKAP